MRRLVAHLCLLGAACVPNYSGMKAPAMPDDMVEVGPLGTVKTYLHRARNELKKRLTHLTA